MSNDLPPFRKVKRGYAASLIHQALSSPRGAALLQLVEFDDHHYRAVFNLNHFQLAEGEKSAQQIAVEYPKEATETARSLYIHLSRLRSD